MCLFRAFSGISLLCSIFLITFLILDLLTYDWNVNEHGAKSSHLGISECVPWKLGSVNCITFWKNLPPMTSAIVIILLASALLAFILCFLLVVVITKPARIITISSAIVSWVLLGLSVASFLLRVNVLDENSVGCDILLHRRHQVIVFFYRRGKQCVYIIFSILFSFLITQLLMLIECCRREKGVFKIESSGIEPPATGVHRISVKPTNNY